MIISVASLKPILQVTGFTVLLIGSIHIFLVAKYPLELIEGKAGRGNELVMQVQARLIKKITRQLSKTCVAHTGLEI